ncbi:Uncharacterised protein [Raoultella terrigena]|uniref:hypothetical protein n=1 Tax=Raoultella terrigena TaxID=577 RepID=UPI000DFCD427|nr:hypothetical protein [Raoultella terrigena]SUQ57673.1 Uncharacterised protein [Raoultella terrigena]
MAYVPPVGQTTDPNIFLDNVKRADELVNGPAATVPDRGGEPLDSWRKMQEDNAALVDETRQNLIPLSKQYKTFEAAQADITNIPEGAATYYRSPDAAALAVEIINNAGTLEPTGKIMISKEYVDALRVLITEEVAKIMASGAAITTDAYPDIAQLDLDETGKATHRRFANGISQFPALMIGAGILFAQMPGGGFVCTLSDTGEELFKISASGRITYGNITTFLTDDESLSGYSSVWMDPTGKIYTRNRTDGGVEQAGEDGPISDTSTYPMVASVDNNIIAVQDGAVTQITSDTGILNIAPVAFAKFIRFLSNISGSYLTNRSTYDGKYRARESKKKLLHSIGAGQSLEAGGSTISQSPVTIVSAADYGVICFSTGTKVDLKYDTLDESLLETVIPARENVGTRPGQESPSSGIAYKIHELTGHTVLVSTAASSGTDIAGISSGTAAFTAATKMIQAAVAMAEELDMEYVPVLTLIHGNQNAASGTTVASYRAAMESLRAQYETVINAATGKTQSLHMFVGQLSNVIPYGGAAGTTRTNTIGIAQYQEARDNEFIHLASAQYARPYSDGEHLTSAGYRTEGEVIGSVIGNWLNDNTYTALMPDETAVVQSGVTITIPLKGGKGSPASDTGRVSDPGNQGFVLTGATISSVAVSGKNLVITKTDSTPATRISYAETGIAGQSPGALTGSRGCIRDSQEGTSLSGLPLYNDLVVFAFQL